MSTRLIPLLFLFSFFGFSQNQFTLSGSVYESEGQETLIGANVICLLYTSDAADE